MLQLPTGGGKTFIASFIMRGMVARGLSPHFCVHRKELLEQTSETFGKVGLEHGWIASGRPYDRRTLAKLVGVQYAARRVGEFDKPDAMVIDEAHHAVAAQWRTLLDGAPGALQLGLSATPERLDGSGLGDMFDELIVGPSVAELMQLGFLSRYRYFAPGKPDLGGVRTRGGDYAVDDLSEIMGDAKLIGDAVEHYLEAAAGEQGITFGVDRKHSQLIADAFNDAGIPAAHVDGSMSDAQRSSIVRAFRAGELRLMCNVDLFGEGFDVPGIAYLGMFRPTKSLAMCMQQWGRSLRIMEGKEAAVICDHAGNNITHGLPDDPRFWSLLGKSARAKRPNDGFGTHTCPMCYQVTPSQVRRCPCGWVFPIRDRNPAWAEGQLFELTPGVKRQEAQIDKAARRKKEEQACKSFADFYDLAIARGYKAPHGWARGKVDARRGKRPGGQRWGKR